jgi:hypothetical protein
VWPDQSFPTRPPGANDNVTFDTNTANSTDDVAQVTNLIMTSNYSGTITMQQNLTVTGTSSSMANGKLDGGGGSQLVVGDGTNNATFGWSGGTIQNGGAMVRAAATANLTGTADKNLSNGSLTVNGTANWDGAGKIVLASASVFVNANFYINGSGTVQPSGTGSVFEVAGGGTLTSQPGANGTATIGVLFNSNSGSNTNVINGQLIVNGGSDLIGTITISSGAITYLNSQGTKVDKLDGGTITGTGSCYFQGNITIASDTTDSVSTTVDEAQNVDGGGTLSIGGRYDWYNLFGSWSGAGKMKVLAGGGNLNLNQTLTSAYQLGRTIDNFGTVTWSSSGRDISVFNGANIINRNGALFDMQVDANILNNAGGSFQNNTGAVLQKSAGNGTTRIDLTFLNGNSGRIEAKTGHIQFTPFLLNIGTMVVSAQNGGFDMAAGFRQEIGKSGTFLIVLPGGFPRALQAIP